MLEIFIIELIVETNISRSSINVSRHVYIYFRQGHVKLDLIQIKLG